jgi:galactose mutarotase-like enzyme
MFTIENQFLKVVVKSMGAELDSIVCKTTNQEYMWNADPAFWAKKSPVLFPIVGTLKNDTYYFEDKAYQLGRHGFAREMDFFIAEQTTSGIMLSLQDNETTLAKYPFRFRFDIEYILNGKTMQVIYRVINRDTKDMYFSVGGHPAFKVPITEGLQYNDYSLEFNEIETTGRWPISKEGLIEKEPLPLLINTQKLPLQKELFYKDAIVLKKLRSSKVKLAAGNTGFEFDFTGFPYLGIWAAKNADFVCIEPWCGIADNVDSDQQLTRKEGIHSLSPDGEFVQSWSFTVL